MKTKTMTNKKTHAIDPKVAETLSGLFFRRVAATPHKIAYHYYSQDLDDWQSLSWLESYFEVLKWQAIFKQNGLQADDSIAIMAKNSPNWVFSEQAALSLGIIVVPLYPNDRAENIAYIINDAQIRALIIDGHKQILTLESIHQEINKLNMLVTIEHHSAQDKSEQKTNINCPIINFFEESKAYSNTEDLKHWQATPLMNNHISDPDSLATIVYTSGTTGKPKGVMLTHRNILFDTWAAITAVPCRSDDLFLSFLPLSHMFERTAGYYIPMMSGAEVAYARSVDALPVDLQTIKPTVLVTVPRIFERIHAKITQQLATKPAILNYLFKLTIDIGWQRFLFQQHRRTWFPSLLLWPLLNKIVAQKIMAKLGGNLRLAISGGAALSNDIAQFFIGLGLSITQGYGMTEAGPVISTNLLDDNDPFSVGQILPGIKTRFTDKGELLIKASNVMPGYWNNDQATQKIISSDGWLHTGDKAEIRNNHLYITGRVKEILVLSNGEKVPPAELEMAICSDPIFEQAIVIGEAKPYLSAIVVLNETLWQDVADEAHINAVADNALQNKKLRKLITAKISALLSSFPGYEQIRRVKLVLKPWTINNGMLTPTMKLKRNKILANYKDAIDDLYAGHV